MGEPAGAAVTAKEAEEVGVMSAEPTTARRTGYDNSSGNYIHVATGTLSNNQFVDIGGVNPNNELRIGCTVLSGGTETVRVTPLRN